MAAVGEAVTVGVASAAVVAVGVEVTAVGVAVAGADRPRNPWAIPRGPETGVNETAPRLSHVPTVLPDSFGLPMFKKLTMT